MPRKEETTHKYLTDEEKKLVDEAISFKQYAESASLQIRKGWEDIWKIWSQWVDPTQNPFNSQKRLSKPIRAVNTLTAHLVAKDPTWNVLPKGDGDDLKAEFLKQLIQNQAKSREILDLKRKIKVGVKSAILFGNGYWKVGWSTLLTKDKKVLYDDPTLEVVHAFDLFVDPYIGIIPEQRKIVHQFIISVDDLKLNKSYKVPSDLKGTYNEGQSSAQDSSRLDRIDMQVSAQGSGEQNKVLVWEVWSRDTGMTMTIADPMGEPCILRNIENPYGFLPFVKMDFELEPVPNRFYCTGAIGPNLKVNKAIDELVNQIVDNVRLSNNSMFKRKRGANVDPRQFIARPGGFVDVDNMDDVDQFRTQDTTGGAYNLLKLLNGEWEAGTAVTSVRMGVGTSDTTAAEANISQQNAEVMTNAVKENMESALSEIGTMIAKLNVKNMDRAHSIRIFDIDLIDQLHKMETHRVFTPDQVEQVKQNGAIGPMSFHPGDIEEILKTGKLQGVGLTPEQIDKAKKYGKIIKFSKEFIDVDADISVEADSTMNQDSAVIRKQVMDAVNTVENVKDNPYIDGGEFIKFISDYSGIPQLKKIIRKLPPPPPQPPQMGPGGGQPQTGGLMTPGPVPGTVPPQIGQMNTPQAFQQSINQGARAI